MTVETILDIHSHRQPPLHEAVTDLSALLADGVNVVEFMSTAAGFSFSVGIHPWNTLLAPPESLWDALQTAAADDAVKAIGECGIDIVKGGPMFRQLQVFKRQVEISERFGKPLIIHDVKAHDIILGLHRDMAPVQKWMIHGFRGKPQLAAQMLQAGLWLSFGEFFNEETLRSMPPDRILAETDDSQKSIKEIIARLSEARGEDLTETVERNTAEFLL